MRLTMRLIAIAGLVVGVGLGVAFGAGVAYGRGSPKTVEGGLTAQQISSLLGINVSQAAAAGQSTTGGQGAAGTTPRGGAAGGAGAGALTALGNSGRVSAINGQTLTIETRQGAVKVNIVAATQFQKLAQGALADLKVGATVLVTGSRKDDGSIDAQVINEVPAELGTILGGATTPQQAGATPQPAR